MHRVARRRLSIDALAMRLAVVAIVMGVVGGCSRAEPAGSSVSPGGSGHPVWSRQAGARGETAASRSAQDRLPPGESIASPQALTSADPSALQEILAAAPNISLRPTGDGGASRIATATGVTDTQDEPGAEPAAQAGIASADEDSGDQKIRISLGTVQFQPGMSGPSIERSARAQLYFDLVQRCRDKDGKILVPDAVKVEFNVDADGYIVASTIRASTQDARYEQAAHCIRRELSAATFRAPPAARGMVTPVTLTIPSVD